MPGNRSCWPFPRPHKMNSTPGSSTYAKLRNSWESIFKIGEIIITHSVNMTFIQGQHWQCTDDPIALHATYILQILHLVFSIVFISVRNLLGRWIWPPGVQGRWLPGRASSTGACYSPISVIYQGKSSDTTEHQKSQMNWRCIINILSSYVSTIVVLLTYLAFDNIWDFWKASSALHGLLKRPKSELQEKLTKSFKTNSRNLDSIVFDALFQELWVVCPLSSGPIAQLVEASLVQLLHRVGITRLANKGQHSPAN